jgi:hypothetical protein
MTDSFQVSIDGVPDVSGWQFVTPQYGPIGQAFTNVKPYDGLLDPIASAFSSSWMGSLYHSFNRSPVFHDPDFDWGKAAADAFKGNEKLRKHQDFLYGAMNQLDFDQRMELIERKMRNEEILADAGGFGLVSQLAVGLTDPTQLIGISRFYKAAHLFDALKAAPGVALKQSLVSSSVDFATNPLAERSDYLANTALTLISSPVMGAGFYFERAGIAEAGRNIREMFHTLAPSLVNAPEVESILKARGLGSVGAAGSGYQEPTGAAPTGLGIEKIPTSPLVRAINSDSAAESNISKQLFAAPFADASNRAGAANPTSAEVASWRWQARLVDAVREADTLFVSYRTGGQQTESGFFRMLKFSLQDAVGMTDSGMLTHAQFKSRVWEQAVSGRMDDPVSEINNAAKAWRRFFDDMSDERLKLGFADTEAKSLKYQTMSGMLEEMYVSRIWNEVAIKEQPELWAKTWDQWRGMLRGDHPHKKMTPEQAAEALTLDRPFVSADDDISGKAKSMHERKLIVPSLFFREFLNTDIEMIARFYARTMGIDIEIGRRFRLVDGSPDVSMRSAFSELRSEAAGKIDAMLNPADPYAEGQMRGTKILNAWQSEIDKASAEARKKVELLEQYDKVASIEDLNAVRRDFEAERKAITESTRKELASYDIKAAEAFDAFLVSAENVKNLRDLLRGTYGQVADPFSTSARAVRVAKQVTAMTLLSGAMAALPDIGNLVLREGLSNTFAPAFVALHGGLSKLDLAGKAVQEAGQALDMVLNSRAAAISDLSDVHGRYTLFERGLDNVSSVAFVFNGMSPWTAMMKQYAGTVIQSGLARRIGLALDGRLPEAELADLRRAGLTDNLMRDFKAMLDAHGEQIESVMFANHHLWTNDALRRRWTEIVAENANRVIVTPSKGELPLAFSHPLGQIIFQFKSFGIATMNRVMIPGLQEKDRRLVTGVMMLVGMGYVVDQIRHAQGNDKRDRSVREQIGRAVERSGVLGYFSDIGRAFDSITDGRFGYGALIGQPHFGSGALDAVADLAGPSVQQAKRVISVGADMVSGNPDAHTARNIRKLMPLNNTAHLDWAFDMIEGGMAAGFR